MVQAGIGGLDTPRTINGDATYLTNQQLDFDISQEQSFQSPSKDNNNLITQLQNGRRGAIKTPRSRVALSDRRNLPVGLGGGEFTPLLKSATRNSTLRNGKENIPQTPAFLRRTGGLDNIPEDFSPLPQMGSSIYGQDSRNGSYFAGTPLPHIDSSSTASTPLALLPRRNEGPGVLQDGNQMSLREQENVIDKIEKENFGLKLKIHFLEEALRKAGPGFSEAALKENTELKVDKITMQKELHRYRITLTAAEHDLEVYRQQILEMQEKVKRKHADAGQREELERLQNALDDKQAEVDQLRSQESQFDDLQDKVHDLEVDLRERDRIINDREDEADSLKDEVEKQASVISDLEEAVKKAQRRAVELEEEAQASEELADARDTIEELERNLKRLKHELDDSKDDREEAMRNKERAQADLEELQDEMANKSITTKGLSRQIEEKANRLQDKLENLREKHSSMEEDRADKIRDIEKLADTIADIKQDGEVQQQKFKDRLELVENEKDGAVRERCQLSIKLDALEKELLQMTDEKDLLQSCHDALTLESTSLQVELAKAQAAVDDLEDRLDHEKTLALKNERDVRDEYKDEIDRLNNEIEDLKADIREEERLIDDESNKWDTEKRSLESERDLAEEKAAGLQRTIDMLQEAEGTLSGKEMNLQQALQSEKDRHESQEAVLMRQIGELNEDVQAGRQAIEEVRVELTRVREELRLSQRDQKSLGEKIEGLEDEVVILQASLEDETDKSNKEIATARQESDSLHRQIHTIKQDLVKAETATIDARAEIAAFQGDLQAGEGSKAQLSSRLRDIETQLSKVRQEKQGLQDQLAGLNLDMHALHASKSDIEAERDELQSQLRALQQQEEVTFRLDQERIDLRTAKMKLDGEVRRLREEIKSATAAQQAIEKELQSEVDRASSEEARLTTEIQDLQRILRGSSEKRDLATAKKTIQQLEQRIDELEAQIAGNDENSDAIHELSAIRRHLADARQKETEYIQREAAQKDVFRGLKRQITELERKAHDAEISRLVSVSPQSSISGSARKSEIIEVRHQLATAHQTLRDVRTQLKDVEKDATRKVKAVTIDLQARSEAWELEKDQLERSLDEAILKKDQLEAKNNTAEASISRLRGKIDRLEKALQKERLNNGEDRTMALERRDLHEMLRETQIQAESLEIIVKERENTIATIIATESELRTQLKRVRDERATYRTQCSSAYDELHRLEHEFVEAKQTLEDEKKALSRGVRFANMSLSVNDESAIVTLKNEVEEREKRHVKELRGLSMQIDWMRARCKREEMFRASAAYAKRYMGLQIDMFEACNKADLDLIRTTGIKLPQRPKRKATFKTVALLVRATIRMKKSAEEWKKSRKIQDALILKVESMKKADKEAARQATKIDNVKTPSKTPSLGSSLKNELRKKSRKSNTAYGN